MLNMLGYMQYSFELSLEQKDHHIPLCFLVRMCVSDFFEKEYTIRNESTIFC